MSEDTNVQPNPTPSRMTEERGRTITFASEELARLFNLSAFENVSVFNMWGHPTLQILTPKMVAQLNVVHGPMEQDDNDCQLLEVCLSYVSKEHEGDYAVLTRVHVNSPNFNRKADIHSMLALMVKHAESGKEGDTPPNEVANETVAEWQTTRGSDVTPRCTNESLAQFKTNCTIVEIATKLWSRTPEQLLIDLNHHGLQIERLPMSSRVNWGLSSGHVANLVWGRSEDPGNPATTLTVSIYRIDGESTTHHVRMNAQPEQLPGLLDAAINLVREYFGNVISTKTNGMSAHEIGKLSLANWRHHHLPKAPFPAVNMQIDGKGVEMDANDMEEVHLRVPKTLLAYINNEAERLGVDPEWVISNILLNTTLANITAITQSLKASRS